MIKNKKLEDRRKKISEDIDIYVKHSFDIVDRIHEILVKHGKEQKDLAQALGKSESEISKWMTGTHNFTLKTIAKIESILGEAIIQPTKNKSTQQSQIIILRGSTYPIYPSSEKVRISNNWETIIQPVAQPSSKCLN